MKKANLPDVWRHLNEFKKYKTVLDKIKFNNVGHYKDFELEITSAITSICGRNGIGKTGFLKLLYKTLTKKTNIDLGYITDEDIEGVSITVKHQGKDVVFSGRDEKEIPAYTDFFDPSYDSQHILGLIASNPDKNWYLENEELQLTAEQIAEIKRVTGKKYTSIKISEARSEEDQGESHIIPLFEVSLGGVSYTNEAMGSGEHKIFMLIWKIFRSDTHSFLFLEEPESFICPLYQAKLMDFIAYYAEQKKLTIIMTTHSEHILSNQYSTSVFSLSRAGRCNFKIVPSHQEYRYLEALGLEPRKNKVMLVEDEFAKLKLEIILENYWPEASKQTVVWALKGESDIEVISRHLINGEYFSVIGVYDADQRNKTINGSKLPFYYLPCLNFLPPEKSVIQCLENRLAELAQSIQIDSEVLEAIVEDHIEDHHDWFLELSRKLPGRQNLIGLKIHGIKIWMKYNDEICRKFIFEMKNMESRLTGSLCKEDNIYTILTDCGLRFPLMDLKLHMPELGNPVAAKLNYVDNKTMMKMV